ncbi:peptide chain release factor N(5)-glutamine methyltransferase [Thiomicrospira microaerophila]|uniref:peptide chain release factor N(5)-glutamine methyltransferase n=1 Tax=Thiomicrospira microaerophila TaxID=406020 RepID=UPI00200D54B4|nr:peptide chain release factor N(5)-glutamine methyltransferase [Thiomicrospira microaerophila]UQB43473.1 peptide chain release factor N(5)-glutamine methyltransferase [Thiomicrospira microaerophila]
MTNQAWLISTAIQQAVQQLTNSANDCNPKLEAEILLCHSLRVNRAYLLTWPEKALTETQVAEFFALVERRQAGEPIAYLLGYKEFWGLALQVSPATLIPRADTETLIEIALQKLAQYPKPQILDMGTGSGAIALALASERPDAKITAIDASPAALAVAQANGLAHQLKINWLLSDWFSQLEGQKFDCIVSNPPYIEQQDLHLTQGDLRFEPDSALSSGSDGLDDLRLIICQAPSYLNQQAWLFVEHGYNQADAVKQLFRQAGFQSITCQVDLAGHPRVSYGQTP